ncbi:hypothetical protein Q0N51_07345 [Priestia megaterium]|uniref:hypothetical protein n=1 Tax=Priestia megaterium TaxID=1404 RepID=UPI0034588C6C
MGILAVASLHLRTVALTIITPGPSLDRNTAVKLPEELVSVARGITLPKLGVMENSTTASATGLLLINTCPERTVELFPVFNVHTVGEAETNVMDVFGVRGQQEQSYFHMKTKNLPPLFVTYYIYIKI